LRLALITSDIRELITLWRSTLLQEILDFARSIDLTKGVIHTGSLDEILTDLSGMHLSIKKSPDLFFHIIHNTVYIVEAKIQGLRNALGTGTRMDTIVAFQNGAWYARHAGCHCDVSRWRRFGTDTWNMHRPPRNTQNSQQLN